MVNFMIFVWLNHIAIQASKSAFSSTPIVPISITIEGDYYPQSKCHFCEISCQKYDSRDFPIFGVNFHTNFDHFFMPSFCYLFHNVYMEVARSYLEVIDLTSKFKLLPPTFLKSCGFGHPTWATHYSYFPT